MKRLPVLAATLAIVASLTVACSSGSSPRVSPAAPPDKVTVVLDWTPNTNHSGLYIAQAQGWYRQAGLDVRIIQPGDVSSLQLLAAGKADVAVSVQEEVVPARAQGLPVVSIAAIAQHNTSSLVSLADRNIRRPRDLAGHTYGGYGGPLEKALVRTLTACDGGNPDKVRFTQVGDADYRAGLTRHQYDVVWIFDGWDGIRLGTVDKLPITSLRFADHTDCIPDWYTPLLASSEKMIASRPDVLKRFMAATTRGYQQAMRDPNAAVAPLMAASPELNRTLVTRSAAYLSTRYAATPAAWGRQDAAVWQRFATFLRKAGLVKTDIDVKAAYTNRFLPTTS
ncbi:MAG: hypothetical protein JWN46_2569 [Acidimicrobiales bacterium]|nr:hypothetical protein [Acidimicrobiales bacterium]